MESYSALMYGCAVANAIPPTQQQQIGTSGMPLEWHSPSSSSHLYPYVNRPEDHTDYTNTNPYMHSGRYNQSHIAQNHDNSNQIESSIGPERRVTRRQRAILAQGPRSPSHLSRESYDDQHSLYLMPSGASRSQTPNPPESNFYSRQSDRLSLNTAPRSLSMQLQSPVYTSSPGSPYSPYDQYPTHSRSTSTSDSIPRSASPSGSVASELTSVSSSASAQNARSFATYSYDRASPIAKQQKHSKKRLDNFDRKSICEFHRDHPGARQEDIAIKYGVERSTISKILKHKVRWLNVSEHEGLRVAKHRPSKFPEVEEQLVKWLIEAQKSNTVLSDALIRSKAKETARSLHISDDKFKASSGWVENFKHRQGIRGGVWQDGKNARMSRGVATGEDGASGVVLSPLNPAFDVRTEQRRTNLGLESNESSASNMPRLGALQPAWQVHPESSDNRDMSLSPVHPVDRPHLSSMHRPIHQQRLAHQNDESVLHLGHVSISPPQHHVHEAGHSDMHHDSHHNASATYDESAELYQPVPTLVEVEDAVNTIITYVNTHGHGLLTDEERRYLVQIKRVIYQAGNGVPFNRVTR